MKTVRVAVAALALLAGGAAHADTTMLAFGVSHHFETKGHKYNELNLGLGVEWQPADSGWLVGGFALQDSLSNVGYALYGGYRARYQFESGIHVEATLRAGFLKDADYKGPALIPSVGIGYGRVTLEATYLPKIGNNKVPAAVLWARIAF
jgi:hypothetical protein